MESPNLNPEKIFVDYWIKKAKGWEEDIEKSNLPEDLKSQIYLYIEKIFIDEYILLEKRDPQKLEFFILSVYSSIQESGDENGKEKFDIYNKIKDAVESIMNTSRLMKDN